GTTPGGGGVLALWLLRPDGSKDVSNYVFSALPAGNAWMRIKTCVMASVGASDGVIKVEMYPSTNNLPLAVDAVEVH
ncbi:MAG TPA: hypothetical protein VLG40_04625, partial [Candidatus Saccharimonas sp.]|nr:hypothetical protein [Candidatus Saccharimonas sp.]